MTPLALPPRLAAVLGFAMGGVGTLADIGTDHALLPIAACLRDPQIRAIAADIRPGPLARAAANIRRYGLQGRIEARLGDGLQILEPGECGTACIAGMGGMRIIEILRAAPAVTARLDRLVLQPQHDIPAVRRALPGLGFALADEAMLREGHRFYTVLLAVNGPTPPHTETEYQLGPCLLAKKDPVLRAFIEYEIGRVQKLPRAEHRALEALYKEALLLWNP